MPKRPKPKDKRWWHQLDNDEVDAAMAEATADSHDECEQHSGLLTAIEDQLRFPFPAKVLGEDVSVVGMEWPEDDEFGLDLVCERSGKRHRVEARSVDLVKPWPEGHQWLAAYLSWKRGL